MYVPTTDQAMDILPTYKTAPVVILDVEQDIKPGFHHLKENTSFFFATCENNMDNLPTCKTEPVFIFDAEPKYQDLKPDLHQLQEDATLPFVPCDNMEQKDFSDSSTHISDDEKNPSILANDFEHSDIKSEVACITALEASIKDSEAHLREGMSDSSNKEEMSTDHVSSSGDQQGPHQCLWCPCVSMKSVDRLRHMKRSHLDQFRETLKRENAQTSSHQNQYSCTANMSEASSGWLKLTDKNTPRKRTHSNSVNDVPSANVPIESSADSVSSLAAVHKHSVQAVKRQHQCKICSKSFSCKSKLERHHLTHSKEAPHERERPHKCEICSKAFDCRSKLERHYLTRSKETPYKCDVCGKKFNQRPNLERHTKTHEPIVIWEMVYKCDICSKRFSSRDVLQRHKRSHTGERPYICDVCGKGFKQSDSLKVHKYLHTKEMPYGCDVCDKRFNHRYSLQVHKRSHTNGTKNK